MKTNAELMEALGMSPGPWQVGIGDSELHKHQVYRSDGSCTRVAVVQFEGDESIIVAVPKMFAALIEGILQNEKNGTPCEAMYLAVEEATDYTWQEIEELRREK